VPGDHRLVQGGPVKSAYTASTRVLSGLLMLVGIAMVVSALVRGGGGLALGVILGMSFILLGAARIWLARSGDR
jgi:multisubunit Na+/H+ antiporter MnhB subunit